MKTNNISKKSFLTSMILMATAIFASRKNAPASDKPRGGSIGGWNPMYIPRRGKFKGYMRENRKYSFNRNR